MQNILITARKRSCGKVVFSQVFVCPRGGELASQHASQVTRPAWVCLQGVCIQGSASRGSLPQGGPHVEGSASGGVYPGGDVHQRDESASMVVSASSGFCLKGGLPAGGSAFTGGLHRGGGVGQTPQN